LTGPNPTDRGKLGTKRHVLTDQSGIPLSVVITAANTHDMKAAIDTLDGVVVERPLKKQNLCLDKGYDFPEIERESTKRRYILHIRHRGEEYKELAKIRYLGRRWVVERTNSWHNRFRKLLVRYEKKSENYLALVCLACCIIVYRRSISNNSPGFDCSV
jgi:putative transposase